MKKVTVKDDNIMYGKHAVGKVTARSIILARTLPKFMYGEIRPAIRAAFPRTAIYR